MNDNQGSESGTRDALIRAAGGLFAERGYDGASVRAITAVAGANLGAVTYHFGSKSGLFEAVLLDVLGPLTEAMHAAAEGPGSPVERLEAVFTAHFRFLGTHPHAPRLVGRIVAAGERLPDPAVRFLQGATAMLGRLVAQGQAAGVIRDGDPRLLAVSVISQSVMLNAMRPVLKAGAGLDLDDPIERERALDHAVRFLRAGLRPSAPDLVRP